MTDGVRVEAPARLHLGLIDLRGDLGRRFGGLGAALQHPRVIVEARIASKLAAVGPEAERVTGFARRFLRHYRLDQGAEIHIREVIPPHVGLGSGTQLALAVARALAELHHIESDSSALALAVGRTERSAVGTWVFQQGGFVLEGGRRQPNGKGAPLLFHHPLPGSWRCVVAIPGVPRGLTGEAEEMAFRKLSRPSTQRVGQISRLTLMAALPALIEKDLEAFGWAIGEIQKHVGDCFREVQGGRFAHRKVGSLVRELERSGAHAVGQSSWGPAVFAIAAGGEQARDLARVAQGKVDSEGAVHITSFDNVGASCCRL